jgi:hypothetical protein
VAYFNDISQPNNTQWDCSNYQAYGFNQMSYLGLTDVGGGPTCEGNGGTRWGQRVNGYHDGAGNQTGQGWGAYSTICEPYQSVGMGDPLCTTDLFDIQQLLWVR